MTMTSSASTPGGVPTPSLDRRVDRLRQPLESPCPPSAHADAAGLSARHRREIHTAFSMFDPDVAGQIDAATFEAMSRALGFRLSRVEIAEMLDAPPEEGIDLVAATRILTQRGYATRGAGEELRMYFRIFDGGNKGHIALDDLRRVQREVREAERELDLGGAGSTAAGVGDVALRAMIEHFDLNGDGVIDEEEFTNIMQPLLSSASS